ncbi:MAG: RNA polymerase sigma factor, partial [bacterium]
DQKPTPAANPGSIQSNPPKPLIAVPESELIKQVLAGDMTAARELYNAHVAAVHRLSLRMTGDPALAQEVTQDSFVRAFKTLQTFRGDAAFATWMHRIATSTALNAIRSRKRWNARYADMDDVELKGGAAQQRREAEPDLKVRLYAAIDALPDIYRAVFVLYDVEGHTHDEIGALLGIPNGTSKARLSAARTKLRAALHEFEGEWANA